LLLVWQPTAFTAFRPFYWFTKLTGCTMYQAFCSMAYDYLNKKTVEVTLEDAYWVFLDYSSTL
jgi:hypothetical protein